MKGHTIIFPSGRMRELVLLKLRATETVYRTAAHRCIYEYMYIYVKTRTCSVVRFIWVSVASRLQQYVSRRILVDLGSSKCATESCFICCHCASCCCSDVTPSRKRTVSFLVLQLLLLLLQWQQVHIKCTLLLWDNVTCYNDKIKSYLIYKAYLNVDRNKINVVHFVQFANYFANVFEVSYCCCSFQLLRRTSNACVFLELAVLPVAALISELSIR